MSSIGLPNFALIVYGSGMVYQNLEQVLVAEDDADSRNLLVFYIERLGLRVLTAEDGHQACEILAVQAVDLLVTDFNMPGLDGIGLLDWCRTRGIHIPVIFLSASSELVPREKIALEDCCATLMLKPAKFDILEKALQAADARVHHAACVHRNVMPV